MSETKQPSFSTQQNNRIRKNRILLISAICGVALVIGGLITAKKVLWPKYKAYQIKQINSEAAELLLKKDPVNAMLLVRKSLQKSQANPEGWRIGAAAAKERGLTEAIYYQNQLCRIEPSKQNRMEMLRIAMAFEQYGLVLATGKDVAKDAANDPEYHEIMAKTYQKQGRPIAAKYHLEILCILKPSDSKASLDLAALELENDKEQKDKNLRARIRGLADQPALKKQALGMLLREAVANRHKVDAFELLSRFELVPELALADRLLLLEATVLCRPNNIGEQIRRLQEDFSNKPEDIASIIDFLCTIGQADKAKPWLNQLPPTMQADEDIRRAVADALLLQKDWLGMTEVLQSGHWEKREYLRQALLSYSFRQRGLITEYFENWKGATMQAGVNPRYCMDLLQRLEIWRWDTERYDIIWKLFHLFPENELLRNQLYAWELKNKNTPNLNRMFMRMLEINPGDPTTQSNFAYSCFLLNANLGRAGLLAQNLYASNPNEPYYVTLNAFFMIKQGKEKEAKSLMESLRQSALSQPERLAIYAFILSKTGDFERASEVIAGVARNNLLPEEKNLIERAEDEIARGSRTREIISRVSALRENAANSNMQTGWLPMLQPETRAASNPSMQLANSLYIAGDFRGMSEILKDDDWHELEYLRHALRAHCLRELGANVQSADLWRAALAGAKRNQVALENLQNLSTRWDWSNERIQAMNALFEVTPNNRLLLTELTEYYRGKKRTTELARLLNTYLADKNIKGDEAISFAYYSILLGLNASQATVRAKDCFEAEPDNTDARYVLAFSLNRQSRDVEAARILSETKGTTSQIVSTALIRALVLYNTQKIEEARLALAEMDKSQALPEELFLADRLLLEMRKKTADITKP